MQCQLDQISTLRTVGAIRKALQDLPKDLEQTYENILARVSPYYAGHVKKALQWLAFAAPMTLNELNDAIIIHINSDYLDEDERLSDPKDILDLCNSLISVTQSGFVRLAHLSVRDYLVSPKIRSTRVAQFSLDSQNCLIDISAGCLAYMSIKAFDSGPAKSQESLEERKFRFPLLEHAAIEWPYYSRLAGEPNELDDTINMFFDTANHPQFMFCVQVLNSLPAFGISRSQAWDAYPRHATPLYYASSFGLLRTVKFLLDRSVPINVPGSRYGGTALHTSILRNHLDVAKLLLEHGADTNRADYNEIVPMITAMSHGNDAAISLLLAYGASGKYPRIDQSDEKDENLAAQLIKRLRDAIVSERK